MTGIDPWRHVDADDDLVADLLAGTVETVIEAGGWIHPDARFVIRQGQGTVACAGEGPLLRIPRAALVPISRVDWTASNEALEFTGIPEELSGVQAELLVLQSALHNACGKIPWLVATHPVLAPDLSDTVVDAVRAFRPGFRRRQPTAASLLWSDRVFRLPVGGSDEPAEPVAVPLIDLLDHARGGATPTWTGADFIVDAVRPTGSAECRLDYGLQRDALGMAVVYGFVASDTDVAHSAPVTVQVPGVGRVRVEGRGRRRDGTLLAPQVRRTHDGLVVSHVVFGASARVVEGLPSSALTAIADENLRLLDALHAAAAACPGAAAATLAGAAQAQARVIRASA